MAADEAFKTKSSYDIVSICNDFIQKLVEEPLSSTIHILLLVTCGVLIYKIYRAYKDEPQIPVTTRPELLKKDMTLAQLRQYDGNGPEKRICLAVNGKVFDVSQGAKFYGPGGPYAAFAGHDATHALATFNVDVQKEGLDMATLTADEREAVTEWEMQFTERYHFVGRLLHEDEMPSEVEEEVSTNGDKVSEEKAKKDA